MRFGNVQATATWLSSKTRVFLIVFFALVANGMGQITELGTPREIIRLGSAQEFYEMATTGQLDLIIDTRTSREWASGHIQNATFIDSLQTKLRNSNDYETTLREVNLWGCRFCRVAVYCASGGRAQIALDLLKEAGFQGQLYNALGVTQWEDAGYPLVNDPSKDDWPCMTATDDATAVTSRQANVCVGVQEENLNTVPVPVIDLTSDEFYVLATTGQIDLIIDTRTAAEWALGHIANATFIDSLQEQLRQSTDYETTLRQVNLWGCRFCRVAVYCRSGRRSGEALELLVAAGFEGRLYNGQGVNQWTEAGYSLVNTTSKDDRPCMTVDNPSLVSKQETSVCVKQEDFGFLEPEGELLADDYALHQADLNAAKGLFMAQLDAHNATAYSFMFTLNCFCPPADYPWLVTAEMQQLMLGVKPNVTDDVNPIMLVNPVQTTSGDVVTSAITSTGENVVTMESTFGLRTYSIMDLFDKIQDAIDQEAHDIQVTYHKDWGYPEDIFIDYNFMMADEEFFVTASDLSFVYPAPSLAKEDEGDGDGQQQPMIGVDEEMPEQPVPVQWAKDFGW